MTEPPPPGPASGEAHLWTVELAGPAALLLERGALLAPDERARAAAFRFELHRDRFVHRRGALRTILGRYLGIDPACVAFAVPPNGKPQVEQDAGDPAATLRFNVSDSEDLALVAVCRGHEVGVDLEHVRPLDDMDAVAAVSFSPAELADWRALRDPAARAHGFYNGWTRKEAWLKARGEGLGGDLGSFDVTLAPGVAARLLRVAGAPDEPNRWCFHCFTPRPGFVAAVATPATVERLVHLAL